MLTRKVRCGRIKDMKTKTENMAHDWKMFDRRLGMFVHWGIYSVAGRHEQIQWRERIPRSEYARLAEGFAAGRFDPDRLVAIAESADAEYIVCTAKHHDGFCMWDTATTDFKVTNTPARRDVLAELAAACHRRGMKLGLYFSNPDWHHPCAFNPISTHQIAPEPGDTPDMGRYAEYSKAQLTELLTRYGEIVCLFWDIPTHVARPDMDALARRLQPGIMINDRGWDNKDDCDYSTPERDWQWDVQPEKPVEACDSVGAVAWGYREREDYRSAGYLARRIDRFLAGGANYILNIGPKADGTVPDEASALMAAVGGWKRRVGEAFRGVETAAGVVAPESGILCTRRGDTLYLHFPDGLDRSGVDLFPLAALPRRATLLNTGTPLKAELFVHPDRLLKGGETSLHVWGIPTAAVADECAVVRLDFRPAVLSTALRGASTTAPGG